MDLTFNLAPSYRDLKDPTIRQNLDDTVEQKRVIDLRACHMSLGQYVAGQNVSSVQLKIHSLFIVIIMKIVSVFAYLCICVCKFAFMYL